MQPIIHLLSDETINQIAAGEVIESPASVIKELIENALDAEAKKITIEILGGGLKMIRIQDDGKGMHREDALLCIKRHATSKIREAQDLFHVLTKGFRGEALAAIASISQMTISTALEGEVGTVLEIERGEILKISRQARGRGTTIEVNSLFYNVPARKKFQKSGAALSAEIFRIVTLMALSHPEVNFELISNRNKTIQTCAKEGSFQEKIHYRSEEMLGKDFIGGSLPLAFEEGPLRFYGLLGAPSNCRTNKMGQYLFINRRAVHCPPLAEAIGTGYATRMEEKKYPIFLLHLSIPTDLIDVNVHPQKLQVRLRKEDFLREKIALATQLALQKQEVSFFLKVKEGVSFTPMHVEWGALPHRLQESPLLVEQDLSLESGEEVVGVYRHFLFVHRDHLLVVDLKAARFRLLFEDLLKKMGSSIEKQGLLIPFIVHLTPIETAMILTHQETIEECGFTLRPIGKDAFMVEAIPPFIEESDTKFILTDMAHALQDFIGKLDYKEERRKKLAMTVAGFARAKSLFTKEEAKQLFGQLRKCAISTHCPKGHPTMVLLSDDAIQDFFRADQKTATVSSC